MVRLLIKNPRKILTVKSDANRATIKHVGLLDAMERVRTSSGYLADFSINAPYGYYKGRPIIGESTRINGGIFISSRPYEALVVDERYGMLESIYSEFLLSYAREYGNKKASESHLVAHVVKFVKQSLRYDPETVNVLLAKGKVRADQKTALDVFLKQRVGVARHQLLLAGYIIEKLRSRKQLHGCLSIDTTIPHPRLDCEKLIYTSPSGYIFVFFPAVEAVRQRAAKLETQVTDLLPDAA